MCKHKEPMNALNMRDNNITKCEHKNDSAQFAGEESQHTFFLVQYAIGKL